ncbi:type II secretion system protein GspM [Pigmentiphaga litoralis]|uniref:type II secretion system protein GspM n=1 Tax=Pigmentiphaga litoralis TaxID=516702 RepID=UPI003B4316B5
MNARLNERMNARVAPALRKRTEGLSRRWARLAPRERRLLAICGTVVGLALVFLVLIEPAWTTYRRLQVQLPLLRTQAATVDALTLEARSLQRASGGRMTPAETRQALADSLRQAGIAGTLEDIAPPADQPTSDAGLQVSVDKVSATALMQWLAAVPAQTRLRLVQAELERPKDENGRLLVGKVSGLMLFVANTTPGATTPASQGR